MCASEDLLRILGETNSWRTKWWESLESTDWFDQISESRFRVVFWTRRAPSDLSEFTVTLNNPNRKKLCFTTVKYRGKSCSRPTSCILSASFFHSLCLCISHDYYRRTQSISNSNLPHTSWIKRFLQWGWRLHHRLHSCCCYAKESRQTLEMRCCKDTALRGPNINTTTGNTRWILKSVI